LSSSSDREPGRRNDRSPGRSHGQGLEGVVVEDEVGMQEDSGGTSAVFSARHDRRKVTDWVYEEVRQAIVELRLKPGAPLREATMAGQLGVSKTPVREALARLEQEGLVETTSFKGAVVSGYSAEDLQEIYELRELLEGAAVRAAATSASDETLARLKALVAESHELGAKRDLLGLAALLGAFDLLIYDQVANERIRALIDNLKAHLARIGRLTEEIPGRVRASVEEHAAIVDAIVARDPDEAERAMRSHIRSVLADQLGAAEARSEAEESGGLAPSVGG
jgi:DNA-binding GntR family transcriptional regulator